MNYKYGYLGAFIGLITLTAGSFSANVSDGILNINFLHISGDPLISGLEMLCDGLATDLPKDDNISPAVQEPVAEEPEETVVEESVVAEPEPSADNMPTTVIGNFSNRITNLSVHQNNRFLVHADGQPFFYMGDTAWELFHRLSRQEADRYLEDRARKGFNVIQAVAMAELGGENVPNAEGHLPLINQDFATPNAQYFELVDYIVDKAESLGLYIGFLPAWGEVFDCRWGCQRELLTSPDKAETYGRWLGERYKDKKNVIWILGGDRIPLNENHSQIIRALANGIELAGADQLMTFHPLGGNTSASFFHNDSWLDFNMFQSGHASRDHANYRQATADYNRTPVKPTIDGEPRYEEIRIGFKTNTGKFTAHDVRQAGYWSVLSGSMGHTYGNNHIWQMYDSGRASLHGANRPWFEALDAPGAEDMGHMRALFESRPFDKLVPDQELLVSAGSGAGHMRASRANDNTYAYIYAPLGGNINVNMARLGNGQFRAMWFNPKNGDVSTIDGTFRASGNRVFNTPDSGRGNDWVLLLEQEN